MALALIEGNATIADYLDDILIDLNATDQELESIQLQLENIYTGMMIHDTLIMNSQSTIRNVNTTLNTQIIEVDTTLNTRITELAETFNEALSQIWATDMELKSQIDLQGMDVEELRQEVAQVHQELTSERATRNNLTILFGLFSVMTIAAIILVNRK